MNQNDWLITESFVRQRIKEQEDYIEQLKQRGRSLSADRYLELYQSAAYQLYQMVLLIPIMKKEDDRNV